MCDLLSRCAPHRGSLFDKGHRAFPGIVGCSERGGLGIVECPRTVLGWQATVHDLPPKPGSWFKAIALGLATDIGGTLVATAILALIYGIALAASGVKREDIAATMQASATDSWLFYVSSLVGLGFSALGGYVCARIVRRSELKFGAILAALSALLGILFAGENTQQLGTFLSLTLLGIGAVVVGARLGQAKNRSGR